MKAKGYASQMISELEVFENRFDAAYVAMQQLIAEKADAAAFRAHMEVHKFI